LKSNNDSNNDSNNKLQFIKFKIYSFIGITVNGERFTGLNFRSFEEYRKNFSMNILHKLIDLIETTSMALFKYFKCKVESSARKNLLDENGPLCREVPASSIQEANMVPCYSTLDSSAINFLINTAHILDIL